MGLPSLGAPKRLALIVSGDDQPMSTLIELEASVSETHGRLADTTDHPVEDGADITDHIRFKPRELEITGIISNTPIVLLPSLRAQASIPGGDPRSRAEDAFAELERVMESGTLVGIVTTLFEYENMALLSLSTPRDAARGNVAELQMRFREIILAKTKKVNDPKPKNPGSGKSKDGGKKSADTASQKGGTSALKTASNYALKLFGG